MKHRPFKHVGVLMGGPSAEREVSLRSGKAVAGGLRRSGYEVTEIDLRGHDLALPPGLDAVFIALHGEFGEDGTVQRQLGRLGIPYTGSGPEASERSFDKILTKQCLQRARIPVPAYELIDSPLRGSLPLPVVTKPRREGSSIGVHRVFAEDQWDAAIRETLSHGGEALVEEFIDGLELTVGIVGDEVLPVIEIRPPDGYYDYRAKYTQGCSEYLVPAPIPAEWTELCRELALRSYRALGCRGMGRIDFRMTRSGEAFVLENNSIPGFTETSLLPKAAGAAGIDFPALCDRIMRMAQIE